MSVFSSKLHEKVLLFLSVFTLVRNGKGKTLTSKEYFSAILRIGRS